MNRVHHSVLSAWDHKLTVMRLFLSFLPLFRTSGKDKTMKTPIEFEYDLWIDENGKCMVRVKSSGEVCEVDRETMRLLRNEEKKLRRSMTGVPALSKDKTGKTTTLLSLDFVSVEGAEDMSPAWLEDHTSMENDTITQMLEDEFRRSLTASQLAIYESCLLGGMSYKEFAASKGVSYQSVQQSIVLIRKKATKIFL
jgi:hypothetical protein